MAAALPAQAALLGYCDKPAAITATQQDRLLRLAAVIRQTLQDSGHDLALLSRSGTDLRRFGQRYSHAGISLKNSANSPWSVRQLYYACAEGVPRIFDQGVPGFVLGNSNPDLGFVSAVLLPEPAQTAVLRSTADRNTSLALLGSSYSANAFAFSTRQQNCNQWVVEMLAMAWGGLDLIDAGDLDVATDPPGPRDRAQAWLQDTDYQPTNFEVGNRVLMKLATAITWVHDDDHPAEDLAQARFRVSMPASIESFVRRRWPGARRVQFCHTAQHIVIRHGWQPLADDCVAEAEDQVIPLQESH